MNLNKASMKNKSSIEWLFEKLDIVDSSIMFVYFEQAKEMHKNEIEETFFQGAYGGDIISAEQYYNETYGGEQ